MGKSVLLEGNHEVERAAMLSRDPSNTRGDAVVLTRSSPKCPRAMVSGEDQHSFDRQLLARDAYFYESPVIPERVNLETFHP